MNTPSSPTGEPETHQPQGLAKFESHLGYEFKDQDLLRQALTHPSRSQNSNHQKHHHNQRLEFLGDAVLQLILTEKLYLEHATEQEGVLTQLRARLVNRTALSEIAEKIKLGDFLLLGRGEERNQGRQRDSNLADGVEAVIGAMYLDQGIEPTRNVLVKLLEGMINEAFAEKHEFNPKGQLQEYLQGQKQPTPNYRLVDQQGPDHERIYEVEVLAGDKVLASGKGSSKKRAESDAAANALQTLQSEQRSSS